MDKKKILGITIPIQEKKEILEKIIKYIKNPRGFFHIVSLNPENLIICQENKKFKKIIETAQIKIIDGIGVVIAGRLNNLRLKKLTGVDLMSELIKIASKIRLRILLIGGRPNLAVRLADCYSQKYPKAKFFGDEGIKDIKKPKKEEEKRIFSIVSRFKPHLVFVAFGSPYQELWIDRHQKKFSKMVVMGVGGAFDFLSGDVSRAPSFIQKIGFEWLYRLINQPWRWRRQLRLIKFIYFILKQRLFNES